MEESNEDWTIVLRGEEEADKINVDELGQSSSHKTSGPLASSGGL